MQLLIFCSLLLAWFLVNFDVSSIGFVMYLLNGVPFSIFVLSKVNTELRKIDHWMKIKQASAESLQNSLFAA